MEFLRRLWGIALKTLVTPKTVPLSTSDLTTAVANTETDSCGPTDADLSSVGSSGDTSSNDPSAAFRKAAQQCELDERNQVINFRKWLFFGSIFTALFILMCLVCFSFLYIRGGVLFQLADYKDWHVLLAGDAIFITLAFIPLSIFWTLAKFVQKEEKKAKEKNDNDIIKSLSSLFSSAKDLISTIQAAIKSGGSGK